MGDTSYIPGHIAVGNLNLDISMVLERYPEEDSHVFARDSWIGLGGAATNYAVAVSKLGHRSFLVAVTGGDAVKLGLLDKLEEEGVDTRFVRVIPGQPTGTVIVILVPKNSSRTIITIRGANSLLSPEMVPLNFESKIVHFASTKPELILSLPRLPELISYDPGGEAYRARGCSLLEVFKKINILFVNDKELEIIKKESKINNIENLIEMLRKPAIIVVKHGAGGATLYQPGRTLIGLPPVINKIIDVTGAGDAFDAAFNVWYLEGASLKESLQAAIAAGAAKVLLKGSSVMPERMKVVKLIKKIDVYEQ